MTWVALKTWNTGDLLTVGDLNNALGWGGDAQWVKGSIQWTPINLLNGTNYDANETTFSFAGWRRIGNWIKWRGLINLNLTTGTAGPTVCVLPYEARPLYNAVFPLASSLAPFSGSAGHGVSTCLVAADGNVYPCQFGPGTQPTNTYWFALDGVSYHTLA